MIYYPTLDDCREKIFPLIRRRMATDEPAPAYELEQSGIDHVKGIFDHMHWPTYNSLLDKGAYLFCSVIGGHPFSNGNKRLAVGVLVHFLLSNEYDIDAPSIEQIQKEFKQSFPLVRWKHIRTFSEPHEYFLYHLALIIADRHEKGQISFKDERQAVSRLLSILFASPS